MRKLFSVVIIFGLVGCVSVEAPDNLVSDTVEVGKEAYHSIKNMISDDEASSDGIDFSYKHTISDGELVEQSSAACIKGAVEQARKTLNVYNIEVKQTVINSTVEQGQPILECSVMVTAQQ